MSLDHEESMIDRISVGADVDDVSNLSAEEKELRKLLASKQELMMNQSRAYLEDLFKENSTIPIKLKNVQVTNSQYFRHSFLQAQLLPLLTGNVMSLAEFLNNLEVVHRRFLKHDILEDSMIGLHQLPKQMWNNKSPLTIDMVPVFNVVPQKRFFAKTGTNIGNGEGDGYIQFQLKNMFGGAESLVFDAITGTKTPSSYLLNYSQPVFNRADYLWGTLAFINTRKLEWIQSSVHTKGVVSRITTHFDSKFNYDIALENSWRALSNHGSKSLEVLRQLKDTFKSSLILGATYDSRDNRIGPTSGTLAKLGVEYSGLFGFNNVCFTKFMWEGQQALALGKHHSVILTNKAGLLISGDRLKTNILDRFHVGGPNDVRSFSLNGVGPKDKNSSVGGDVFFNGGISLLSHIPKTPEDTNFKLINYLNFGKLASIDSSDSSSDVLKLMTSGYSVSAGVGVLYNHPMARFELNFGLPIVAHANDHVRKGIQYGVGVSFL